MTNPMTLSIRRTILMQPFIFESWLMLRARWFALRRKHQPPPVTSGTTPGAQHLKKVLAYSYEHRRRWSRFRTQKMINILRCVEGVSPDSRVLCIGPRNEAEILLMSLYGFDRQQITAIDLYSESPLIEQMDMHDLKFPENSFDVVYVLYTLTYSYNITKACREIIRVLKNRGIVVTGFVANAKPSAQVLAGSQLRGGLRELFELFSPHVQHIYWQEEEASPYSPDDRIATTIFRIEK